MIKPSANRVASRYVEAGLLKAPPAMVKEITEWVQTNVARGLVIHADYDTKRRQRLQEEDRGEDPVDPEAYDLARKDSGGSTRFEDKKVFPVDLKGWPYLRSFSKSLDKEIAETERRLEREQEQHRNKVDAAKVISRMNQTLIQEGGNAAVQAVMEAHPDLDKSTVWNLVYFYDPAKFDVPEPSIVVPDFLRTLFDIPQKENGGFTKRTFSEIRTLLKKVGSMPPLKIAGALLSERRQRNSVQNLDEITVEIMWGNEAKAPKGTRGRWSPSSHSLQVFPMNMRDDPLGDIVWYRSLKNMIATAVDHELQHMTQDLIQILGGLSEAGGLPSRNIRRTRTPAESGSQMLSEGEKYYLSEREFYTWLTTSVRNFLNDMAYLETDRATPREWDRHRKVYIDLSAFFKTLKKHAPDKWRKAVGEFWKATEQPRSSRVASRPEYGYHATFLHNLDGIASSGLLPSGGSQFGGGYSGHSRGRVFLSDWRGVSFWMSKMEGIANHNSDFKTEDDFGWTPISLRVDIGGLEGELSEDELGRRDSGQSAAWYVEETVDPDFIEVWNGSRWVPVRSADPDTMLDQSRDAASYESDEDEEYDEWGEPTGWWEVDFNVFMPGRG